MSTAHTATPWMVVHELRPTDESVADLVNDTWVIPANGQQLGSWHADAAFIVRACNAHDDLVEKATALANEFQYMAELLATIGGLPVSIGRDNSALVDMRAALTAAQGE